MIKLILSMAKWLLTPILSLLNFGSMPAEVLTYVSRLITAMQSAMGILGCFVNLSLIGTLLDFILSCEAVYRAYTLLMWVYRKIPVVGAK